LAQLDFSNWKTIMDYEYNSLLHNQTWILVPCPLDPSMVGCKWVNKCKYKDDMTLDRYKARLVVEGFIQVEGLTIMKHYSLWSKSLHYKFY
jgi:hypothetical protein